MGETVVVDQNDIRTLEDEVGQAASNYIKSYNALSTVMQTASTKSIRGPLADSLKQKFDSKEDIFNAIRDELQKAEQYLGDKSQQLGQTINNVMGNMR